MSSNLGWQSYAGSTNSWLSLRAVDAIRADLPALAEEVLQAIQREVPDYSRPLNGDFGHGVRSGTEIALRRFIGDQAEDSRAIYRSLGYGEHRAGRSLDALQSAYRVGARIAWRRMSQAASAAGASAETQRTLAEAMFAYIDQLAAESIEGYAEAQLAQAGDIERRRAALFATLIGSPPPDAATLLAAAEQASWTPPRTLACLVISGDLAARVGRRLSGDILSSQMAEATYVIVPNPTGLEREAAAAAQRLHVRIGVGPQVAVGEALVSLKWARLAHELGSGEGTVVAERRLADIALRAARDVVAVLRERSLAPLAGESERSRARLEATLRAWLEYRGSQHAIASELGVHPQTVRYRLRRLRELFGSALEDPEQRFELEIALREV
jgi:hypothetical protein